MSSECHECGSKLRAFWWAWSPRMRLNRVHLVPVCFPLCSVRNTKVPKPEASSLHSGKRE